MPQTYSWPWVESQVAQTIKLWEDCSPRPYYNPVRNGPQYDTSQQKQREQAYDEGLSAVEREARRAPRSPNDRLAVREKILEAFGQFSARALDLKPDATKLLTRGFLPVGVHLARWARSFDETLTMPAIIQACRNAWTAGGLQPLLGEPVHITPAILGYSLLYPYSDNFLDNEEISPEAKIRFCARFRGRLRGESLTPRTFDEAALWTMVGLIEGQFPRVAFPNVFDCLLAIHRAQEESVQQVQAGRHCADSELLRMSCAKGGTSVLADAILARGYLTEEEARFAFEWGVLLQLGDDLQDVQEDLASGSVTLFSRTAAQGKPLDHLVIQLLGFADRVGTRMDGLAHGSNMLRDLLRMSWRSLIVGAVAYSHEFFSPGFLVAAERCSPFRFAFLRARRERLTSREGLYATLFDAFLEAPPGANDESGLPSPDQARVHAETSSQEAFAISK